jgi:hypothetical protein
VGPDRPDADSERGGGCTRREFLAAGACGLCGAALAAGCSSPGPAAPRLGRTTVRTLGRTGLKLPVVGIGSAHDPAMVRAALDAGLVYVHTSSSYEEQNHERMVGEVLRGRPRESFVIASNPDLPYRFERGQTNSFDLGTSADPALIARSLQGSLERLGLDRIDIYYLASLSERRTVLHEPYLKAFEALKRAGTIRFTGITTHRNEPEVIRAAVDSGAWDVVVTSYNFRQSHREEVRAAIAHAAQAGLGIVAMKTQAGVYWDGRRRQKINMKAALKWVLQDEHVHTTVPAFSNHDELREDLAVMEDLAFSPGEERDLRLGERLGLPGLFCQQCAACLPQCPHGVDVLTLMRGHMYAVGYGDPRRAARLVGTAGIACARCDDCRVRCAQGFDVRDRAIRVASLVQGSHRTHA